MTVTIYGIYRSTKGLYHVRVLHQLDTKQIGRKMANVNQMTRAVLQPPGLDLKNKGISTFPGMWTRDSLTRNRVNDPRLRFIANYYYWYSALGPVWAETRVQSGDWYGSGTLHPGQVLRGSLPLLSPAF